jgi:hypothetical protein
MNRPRVVYMIFSHQLPGQLLRLCAVLRAASPDASIVVHHDARGSGLDQDALSATRVQLLEPRSAVTWGAFSHLATFLRCLQWTLTHLEFDWLVSITGQDYPVRPVAEIEHSLLGCGVDAFIETGRCDRPPFRRNAVGEFTGRYHYRWRRVPARLAGATGLLAPKARPLLLSRTLPTGTQLGIRAWRSPFGPALACHCGSDCFTLSRRAVEAVDRFVRTRPDVVGFYRRTIIPTESFVQTVLANTESLRLSGDYRRYMVWDRPHMTGPRILRSVDLEQILSSGAHFARKFDETVDSNVLDEIDRSVHSTIHSGARS